MREQFPVPRNFVLKSVWEAALVDGDQQQAFLSGKMLRGCLPDLFSVEK